VKRNSYHVTYTTLIQQSVTYNYVLPEQLRSTSDNQDWNLELYGTFTY